MDEELKRASSAGPAPLEQVRQSVHSDLQYVSLQMDGKTYGGWYRVLSDGQMELLALANMHCERRHENTAIEQARGMLGDFIRAARQKSKKESAAINPGNALNARTDGEQHDSTSGTLGDLLYADETKPRVSEKEWLGLVQSIAAGDQLALHGLYERTHRVVFTLLMRLTNDPQIAGDLTLDVFHDLWRLAPEYDAGESVVAWIMNQARCRAIDRLRFEQGKNRVNAHASSRLPMNAASDSDEVESFVYWPSDVLRPSEALWERLAQRIAAETGDEPASAAKRQWMEPEWAEVAPGISCKLLATDTENDRVSMLVRLAPGVEYPPHRHAGVEQLHLLHGELLINDRKLHPGDYNRAEPGSSDKRVWSETGCTCVLITSTRDAIG